MVTAGVTLLLWWLWRRLPLGTASALEFLGPLTIAVCAAAAWPVLGGGGCSRRAAPDPAVDRRADPIFVACALGAAVCWAAYILLTQRVGDAVSGMGGLAIWMPVAALVATLVAGPGVSDSYAQLLLYGLGLAILLPVVPFALELARTPPLTTGDSGR